MSLMSDINDWKNNETTKKVFDIIQNEIDSQIAYIASGSNIRETTDATAMETCRVAGLVKGLSFIFNIEEEVDESEGE